MIHFFPYSKSKLTVFLGGHGGWGTPDPIPNSEVKPTIADDTAGEPVGK